MNKKKSGAALFIDIVINICVIICIISFAIYYTGIYHYNTLLWIGVTTFTIVYHLGLRLVAGNLTTKIKHILRNESFLFKERKFESTLYKILRVKKWKKNALTYDPSSFSLKENTKEEILSTMLKSELDHWINELISLSTLFFGLIWGEMWIFMLTCFAAMIFDAQFICIQRYNRPRLSKLIDKEKTLERSVLKK